MSSLTESVKFAQLPRKPKSDDMTAKQEILAPLIKSVFPDLGCTFIDNPMRNSVDVMMRKGDRFIYVVFYNDHFLKPAQERDAYFVCLLQVVNQNYESKLEAKS